MFLLTLIKNSKPEMASAVNDLDWAGAADAQEKLVSRVRELNVTKRAEIIARGGEEEKPMTVAERSLLDKVLRRGLVDNKHDLEIERRNPNSPLFSVKSFEALNLKPELLKVSTCSCADVLRV